MAVSVTTRTNEIARIKSLDFRLNAKAVVYPDVNGAGGVFDLLVQDNRPAPDNESMGDTNSNAITAAVTVRPGVWVRYEPGSGGASTYSRSDQVFTAVQGGGCTTGV